jgi:hypothetical protein
VQTRHTARTLEYEVLHELCHLLIGWLVELAEERHPASYVDRVNEQATRRIARALWVAKYGREPPVPSDEEQKA